MARNRPNAGVSGLTLWQEFGCSHIAENATIFLLNLSGPTKARRTGRLSGGPTKMTATFRRARKSDYDVLGVKPTDDLATVRQAWRKLVRTYHPDAFDGDKSASNEFLARVNAAYEAVLCTSANKRKGDVANDAYRDSARRKAQAAQKAETAGREQSAAARRTEAVRAAEAKRQAEAKREAEAKRQAVAGRRAEEQRVGAAIGRAAAERRAEALRRSETVPRDNVRQSERAPRRLSAADRRAASCAIASFEAIRSIASASAAQSPAFRI